MPKKVPKVALTIAKTFILDVPTSSDDGADSNPLASCTLKWRQQRLWVSPARSTKATTLPALNSESWLKECLDRSNVSAVCLDPELGEAALMFWADVCERAKKPVFLRLPSLGILRKRWGWAWLVKRCLDWISAGGLVLILSPALLLLVVLIRLNSPEAIFSRQWRIGQRGKLFRILQFRCLVEEPPFSWEAVDHQSLSRQRSNRNLTHISYWINRSGLGKLPQLFNILRGEMSFVGIAALPLQNIDGVAKPDRRCLSALPGMIKVSSLSQSPASANLYVNNNHILEYLGHWSIKKDFEILLLSVSKLFSHFVFFPET